MIAIPLGVNVCPSALLRGARSLVSDFLRDGFVDFLDSKQRGGLAAY
jgi:hypothetical protein